MTDYFERSTIVHRQLRGKISLVSKMPIETRDDLSIAYTPGVVGPCELIAKDPSLAQTITEPTADRILPDTLDKRVAPCVANAVAKAWDGDAA